MKFVCLLLFYIMTNVQTIFAHPPQEMPFFKLSETADEYDIDTNFKRIHSFLANEHLPVWIVHAEFPEMPKPMKYIMKQIGRFYMYQDLNTCAAAVYFEEKQQFYGTIDHRYVIEKFNPAINPIPTEGVNLFKSELMIHPDKNRHSKTGISAADAEIKPGKNWRYIESRIEEPDFVYVETLVIVNYDIVDVFRHNYAAIVSEILITFNSIDMLYSKINEPRMKINIAGIIIGKERDSFPILIKNMCYKLLDAIREEVLFVACANHGMKSTLETYQKVIPLNSYDIVVFLTDFGLFGPMLNTEGKRELTYVGGYASSPLHDDYFGYTLSSVDTRLCTVGNFYNYQSFSSIAHEMAHLFSVLHDPGQFRSLNGKCIGNMMRSDGYYCMECLHFADKSIHQMRRFFRSRDGCKFRNEPRSLNDPSKPRLFWNEHKQCQCYGFFMAKKPQKIDCESRQRLKCLDGAGNNFETGFFMDGTLCNQHEYDAKVCWNGECKAIMK